MSVQPHPWPEVPEQTVSVARAAYPKGALAMRARDELPRLFADEQFASAFRGSGPARDLPDDNQRWSRCWEFAENLYRAITRRLAR
jgi:hypothetical protein